MDFRITIDSGPASQQQASQAQQPVAPAEQLGVPPAPLMPRDASRDWRQEYRSSENRLLAMREQFGQDMPATEAARLIEEEKLLRQRRNEVMKERMKQDTAEMEARRNYQDDIALRTRHLEVLRERHRIEGAAAEEARIQLAQQKEAKEWQEKVNAERRKQDPSQAFAEDMDKIGGLIGQVSGGGGSMGLLGRFLQMAPAFKEQFGSAAGASGATSAASGAAGAEAGASGAAAVSGGAAGSLAAMAGPIGLAVAAVEMGAKKSADDIRGTSEAIKGFGEQVVRLNSNDHLGAFQAGVSGTAKVLEGIPVVGQIAAAHVERFGTVVGTAAQVVDSFVQRGAELARFSGEISVSRAMADVRTTMGDIREADQLGPVIARLTDSQSEIQDILRELLLPVREVIAEAMSAILDLVKDALKTLRSMDDLMYQVWWYKELIIGAIKVIVKWGGGNVDERKAEKDINDVIARNFGNILPGDVNRFGFGIGDNPLPGAGF